MSFKVKDVQEYFDTIEVHVDGMLLATIPGTFTQILLQALPLGDRSICVRGVKNGLTAVDDCCDVFVGPKFIRGDCDNDGGFANGAGGSCAQTGYCNGGTGGNAETHEPSHVAAQPGADGDPAIVKVTYTY